MKKLLSFILIFVMMAVSVPFVQAAAPTKLVAITFDDGPSIYTPRLLDGLKARGAKATFFCVGEMIPSRKATLKRAADEGHQIANHTVSHPDLSSISETRVRQELSGCRNYLVEAAGEQMFCIRPPYGSYNSTVRRVADGPIILWSVDTLDWKYRNSNTVYNNIMNNTTDGSIILLHDLYSTSVDGALRAIDSLQAQGYEFVTVNELFRRRAITLEAGKVYSSAYNKGITLPKYDPPKAPSISFENVIGGKTVSITCPTDGADIYYTLDGSEPTENSKKYTGPFMLTDITTVRAVSFKEVIGGSCERRIWVEPAQSPTASYKDGHITLTPAENTFLSCAADGGAYKDYTKPISVKNTLEVKVTALGKANKKLTYSVTPYGHLLTDAPASAWYFDEISEAMNLGLMNGTGNMTFNPTGNVTRAMFVTVLHRVLNDTETEYQPSSFKDVDNNGWYADAVAWAQAEEIVLGVSKTEYAPDKPITREQMCVMLDRFFERYEYTLELTDRPAFEDANDVSPWAVNSVDRLYKSGLINGVGDNTFCPLKTATRAQCAKLMVDTYKIVNAQ